MCKHHDLNFLQLAPVAAVAVTVTTLLLEDAFIAGLNWACPFALAIAVLRLVAVVVVLLASLRKYVTPLFSVPVEPVLSPFAPLLGLYLTTFPAESVKVMKAVGVTAEEPATKSEKGLLPIVTTEL